MGVDLTQSHFLCENDFVFRIAIHRVADNQLIGRPIAILTGRLYQLQRCQAIALTTTQINQLNVRIQRTQHGEQIRREWQASMDMLQDYRGIAAQ